MNKTDYLNNCHVKNFVSWLAQNHDQLNFNYANFQATTFPSVLDKYDWGRLKTFDSNNSHLEILKTGLSQSILQNDDTGFLIGCMKVQKWGGTENGNLKKLLNMHVDGTKFKKNEFHSIIKYFEAIKLEINSMLIGTGDINNIPTDIHLNSGFSKIYSLLVDKFIIFDSRVSAALGCLVNLYISSNNITLDDNFKACLFFPWLPAKSKPNRRKAGYILNSNATSLNGADYTSWNIKASWLVEKIVKDLKLFPTDNDNLKIRKLEPALFMIGYDINKHKLV